MKEYFKITKPGIICGNLISTIGGYLLSAKGSINYYLFIFTLLGTALIIASGNIYNNYLDQDIDKIMQRTKNRSLVQGLIKPEYCLIYATLLFVIGILILWITTNFLTIILSFIGLFIYVYIYTFCMKRKSIYSTLIGSLSGAIPPNIGYCAVSSKFDIGALILSLIFTLWQMPHAYALAIYYFKDYQNARIPVLPVIKGVFVTKIYIFFYVLAFVIATIILVITGYTGYKYLIITTFINLCWLLITSLGFQSNNDDLLWSRITFIFSIITIFFVSVMMSIDPIIKINKIII